MRLVENRPLDQTLLFFIQVLFWSLGEAGRQTNQSTELPIKYLNSQLNQPTINRVSYFGFRHPFLVSGRNWYTISTNLTSNCTTGQPFSTVNQLTINRVSYFAFLHPFLVSERSLDAISTNRTTNCTTNQPFQPSINRLYCQPESRLVA